MFVKGVKWSNLTSNTLLSYSKKHIRKLKKLTPFDWNSNVDMTQNLAGILFAEIQRGIRLKNNLYGSHAVNLIHYKKFKLNI